MNNSSKIIELIFEIADKKKMTMTELAEQVGSAKSTLSRYKNNKRDFPINDIGKYAKALNVSVEYLLGLEANSHMANEYTYFPTAISAGLPLEVDGITESSKIAASDEFLGKWANNKDIFFAHINGDSMNRLMDDGSLIAIKPVSNTDELKNGDIVVYSVDGEYSVKHYYKYGDTLVFKPNSTTEHEEHTYNVKDNIIIHGVVVTYVINRD